MLKRVCYSTVFLGAFVLSVCASSSAQQQGMPNEAVAVIQPASGSNCHGIVRFTQVGDAVKVVADIEGLTPGAQHGFHVHEFGDCSAADATSAGSHYDPDHSMHHGHPEDQNKHAGDLGNLQADSTGKAHYDATVKGMSVSGPHGSIVGHAVIVHARPDDFGQPVGNAGGRIGCGVIGVAKSAPK